MSMPNASPLRYGIAPSKIFEIESDLRNAGGKTWMLLDPYALVNRKT
jgi:hypothetical protein